MKKKSCNLKKIFFCSIALFLLAKVIKKKVERFKLEQKRYKNYKKEMELDIENFNIDDDIDK